MTLLARNNCFKAGIILAAFSLCLIAIGGYVSFQVFPEVSASAAQRSRGVLQILVKNHAEPSAYMPFWTMLGAALYSLVSIILIFYFFEKTQSPEILFIALFVISLTFEFARITIPLNRLFSFPLIYLTAASRVLLFGRYFGVLSLFAASVYAAGLDAQKQQNIFLMLVLAALVISLNIPIDSMVWDSTLTLQSGYGSMFSMVELGLLVITMFTFIVSAYTRGSRNYIFIGIGTLLIFAGRNILLHSDTWITPIPGLIILAVGTWYVCSRLHLEYLWL
ncbi:MAG: hypothetical protein LBH42_06480 [Treponema sp.]|jgi:hypothetical protein|nr:hypothetical protein [Treponema sp.]